MKRSRAEPVRPAKRTRGEMAAAVPRPLRRPLGTFSGQRVHTFTRSLMMHHNVTDAPLQNNATSFVLNALPSYGELTALFDVYRISKVKATFICDRISADVPAAATNLQLVPNLWVCSDFDDAAPLASELEWGQHEGAQWKSLARPVTHTVYPRIATAVYSGAFTSYGNTRSWVDCSSPGVQFYGIKWAYDCNSAGGAGTVTIAHMNIKFDVTVECRGQR